jgi:hypothetical protein
MTTFQAQIQGSILNRIDPRDICRSSVSVLPQGGYVVDTWGYVWKVSDTPRLTTLGSAPSVRVPVQMVFIEDGEIVLTKQTFGFDYPPEDSTTVLTADQVLALVSTTQQGKLAA